MPPGHLLADVLSTCSDGRSQTEDTLKGLSLSVSLIRIDVSLNEPEEKTSWTTLLPIPDLDKEKKFKYHQTTINI